MLASAYAVADGGRIELSPELMLVREIAQYGASAVMGRPLYHHEIIRLRAAESVLSAYNAKFASEDWAAWARANPELDALLNTALRLAEKYGWQCN